MTRCTGHCCRCLSLKVSPIELREMYDQCVALLPHLPLDSPARGPCVDTIHVFEAMNYLGFGVAPFAQKIPDEEPKHWYSCRHVLPNGDCEIYDQRMQMCRRHPVSGVCNYAGCTL